MVSLYAGNQQQFDSAAEQCIQEVNRLEDKYSRYRDDSLLSNINRHAGDSSYSSIDPETFAILNYADVAYTSSEGLFDITSGVLRKAWDFKSGIVPSQDTLNALIEQIGWSSVEFEQTTIRLPKEGMEIDFGGIVKEYAADSVANIARRLGIKSGLIDLGGDMSVVGPHPDGSPWQIGISDPSSPKDAIATISLVSGGLATSGDYARYFEWQGKRYSHLLDPRTGWPVQGLRAVSIWHPNCVVAGSLSTIAMLHQRSEGLSWLESLGVNFLAVDNDGILHRND